MRLFVVLGAFVTLVLAGDLLFGHGKTARGATVAGLDAGGLNPTQARALVDELGERSARPVTVTTPSGRADIAPADLGLSFDPDATYARLLEQPGNPFRRIAALFGAEHAVEPVVSVDRAAFDATLDGLRKTLEKAAVEGGVHFEKTVPVGDLPAAGLRIDRDRATSVLATGWLAAQPVAFPMEPFQPTVDAATVQAAVAGPAVTAMSGGVVVEGEAIKKSRTGTESTETVTAKLSTAELSEVLTFGPDGRGGLKPVVDEKAATAILEPRLARTEREAVSARFEISGGAPRIVEHREGAEVDWAKTAEAVAAATLAEPGDRTVDAAYEVLKPKLTTTAARKLGVREVVSEYATGGFTEASGTNIRLVAEKVDGAVILPGEKFSLNGFTGPRGEEQGYVTSTIIDHGHASKAVGGGISQFATTLYNAAYFAGLEDVDHTEHAYYISRYPEAREATVFEGSIDLVFRNNTAHGIYVETSWTSSEVRVRLWSTKTFDVESVTGPRVAYTDPSRVDLPDDENCIPSRGSRGFTASDTRIISDAASGAEIGRHTRTVKYDPEPIVRCRG